MRKPEQLAKKLFHIWVKDQDDCGWVDRRIKESLFWIKMPRQWKKKDWKKGLKERSEIDKTEKGNAEQWKKEDGEEGADVEI